jgi:hypothetical protein
VGCKGQDTALAFRGGRVAGWGGCLGARGGSRTLQRALAQAPALEGNGVRCELDLGSSHFRIPLAVDRADEDGFRLAVLTDEGSHITAFERYVHHPTVLKLRG